MIFQKTIGEGAHVLLGEATQKDGKGSLKDNSITIYHRMMQNALG